MKTKRVILALLASAGLLLAQGPRGPRSGAAGLDMSRLHTVEGSVTAVHIAYGTQYPFIEIDRNMIKVAPVWFLQQNDFAIKPGDRLILTAAPRNAATDPYLYAIEITNPATTATLRLRDAKGIPLWAGGRGPVGRQGRTGCVDAASIRTVSGVVDKVSYGAGIPMPFLILRTEDGKLLSLKIGPERILLAQDFEIRPGEIITARIGLAACSGELVALQLSNAAGKTVVLRNDNGTPL